MRFLVVAGFHGLVSDLARFMMAANCFFGSLANGELPLSTVSDSKTSFTIGFIRSLTAVYWGTMRKSPASSDCLGGWGWFGQPDGFRIAIGRRNRIPDEQREHR